MTNYFLQQELTALRSEWLQLKYSSLILERDILIGKLLKNDHFIFSLQTQKRGDDSIPWNGINDGDNDEDDINIIDPPIEPVYPIEYLILALLPIGALLELWRLWVLSRRIEKIWQLGEHKSPQKWANRIIKGNWTPEKISETIKNGERFPAPNKVHPQNTATRFQLGDRYVVKDDVTNEILQLSGPDFIPNKM